MKKVNQQHFNNKRNRFLTAYWNHHHQNKVMSKKFSPTSISSKLSQSKKQTLQKQTEKEKPSLQKSSSGHSSSQFSQKGSDLSSSDNQFTQQKVMEEAIEKASCLIELLTRQNSQYKLQIENLLEQIQKFKLVESENEVKSQELLSRYVLFVEENKNLHKQNQQLLFQLEKAKLTQKDQSNIFQKLQETKSKNKKLHEKIAFLAKTSIDVNKELEQLKKYYKSLQNQNLYLLNELKKFEQKENIFQQNISAKQNSLGRKINDLEATKQAFACRTQELKQQNLELLIKIQELRKQKYDLEIISRQSIQTLDAVTKKLESYQYVEERVHSIYHKIKLSSDQMTSQVFLRVQKTIVQKLEQIEVLVTYRLQHMEKLMKQIFDRVEKPDWKSNIRELNETKILAQRLSTYLSQLTSRPILAV